MLKEKRSGSSFLFYGKERGKIYEKITKAVGIGFGAHSGGFSGHMLFKRQYAAYFPCGCFCTLDSIFLCGVFNAGNKTV